MVSACEGLNQLFPNFSAAVVLLLTRALRGDWSLCLGATVTGVVSPASQNSSGKLSQECGVCTRAPTEDERGGQEQTRRWLCGQGVASGSACAVRDTDTDTDTDTDMDPNRRQSGD
eukprot:574081-Rhodomonas_salina.2